MNLIDRNAKSLTTFLMIKCIATLLFTIALIGFEALPMIEGSDSQYISQAALQRTRSQIFVKSVLVLLYRPNEERMSAISDLQTVLPLFEQEQAVLLQNTTRKFRYFSPRPGQIIWQSIRRSNLSWSIRREALI